MVREGRISNLATPTKSLQSTRLVFFFCSHYRDQSCPEWFGKVAFRILPPRQKAFNQQDWGLFFCSHYRDQSRPEWFGKVAFRILPPRQKAFNQQDWELFFCSHYRDQSRPEWFGKVAFRILPPRQKAFNQQDWGLFIIINLLINLVSKCSGSYFESYNNDSIPSIKKKFL